MSKERLDPFIKGVITGAGTIFVANKVGISGVLQGMDTVGGLIDRHLPADWVKKDREVPQSIHLLDPKKYKVATEATEAIARGIYLENADYTNLIYDGIEQGAKILIIANHMSHLDHTGMERAFAVNGHSEIANRLIYFTGSRIKKDEKMNWMLDALNTIDILQPDDRDSFSVQEREALKKSTEKGMEYVWENGYIPVLYPEGSRSDDETLQPFKPGSSLIMKQADIIVALGIDGTQRLWPKRGRIHPKASSITMTIGEVFPTEEFQNPKMLRLLLKRAQYAVASALPLHMQGIQAA